jgi:hypothetical protein
MLSVVVHGTSSACDAIVHVLNGTSGHELLDLQANGYTLVTYRASHLPKAVLDGHARRGDFSRWLRDVFGDHPLALEVHALEERSRSERESAAGPAIASAIRGRYDLTPDDAMPCGGAGK